MNAIHAQHHSQDYRSFLEAKIKLAAFAGFDVDDDEINPLLKPHQRAIVRWAIKGGRRAIFAACFQAIGAQAAPIQGGTHGAYSWLMTWRAA